ncbi:unnamed protein product, partial [Linum tenue]
MAKLSPVAQTELWIDSSDGWGGRFTMNYFCYYGSQGCPCFWQRHGILLSSVWSISETLTWRCRNI